MFDYNDPNTAVAIRERTKNGLTLAFDTISTESNAKYYDCTLSPKKGDYSSLLPINIELENDRDRATMAYTAFGDNFKFKPNEIPARPHDRAFCVVILRTWWRLEKSWYTLLGSVMVA
ncbi:hypothetical protein PENANT_c024G02957 [Penicillium antarcticum]|uniref:Uncharacterized protein n=1 Tax=Penicillium antarcticum TaxID=416450 RepID=A0A1V6PY47_9EURO|nr:hypothetical protein PENANT_c024G02957 [Penicillium antarcticum]